MKITSGRWVARYSIADSAFSALSTSSSYFSRIRARNSRADLESSTINARFTAMLAPIQHPKSQFGESVAQNGAGPAMSQVGDESAARQTGFPGIQAARS